MNEKQAATYDCMRSGGWEFIESDGDDVIVAVMESAGNCVRVDVDCCARIRVDGSILESNGRQYLENKNER